MKLRIIKLIYFSTLSNFSSLNYKPAQNRQDVSFSGKQLVQMNLFGEKYLVPRKVADVRRSIACAFAKDKSDENKINVANAINIEDNLFLGVAHLFDGIKELSLVAIGKFNNRGKRVSTEVSQHIEFKELDLGLLSIDPQKIYASHKYFPAKFAKELPKRQEQVFIVGRHLSYKGTKVIPAVLKKTVNPKKYNVSSKATCLKISSDWLKDKINPHGLSSAAVVNREGEVIGVLLDACYHRSDGKSTGVFYGISTV